MKDFAVIAVFVVGALIAGWFWIAGPCEAYVFASANEVPARCLMGDK